MSYIHRRSIDTSRQYFHTLLLRQCSLMQMKKGTDRHVSSSAVSSTRCLTPHSQPRPSNLPPDTKAYFVWHNLAGYQVNEGYHAENLPNKKGPYLRIPPFRKGENKYSNIGNQKRTVKVYITTPFLSPLPQLSCFL